MRTSFLPGLALWSLFPRPQSHGPTFWTVFYGKRLVNGVHGQVDSGTKAGRPLFRFRTTYQASEPVCVHSIRRSIGCADYLASRRSLPFVKNGRTLGACFDRMAALTVLRCVE